VAVGGSRRAPVIVHRERVELLDGSLPRQPYHVAAEDGLSLIEGADLISRVEQAAATAATHATEAIVATLTESGHSIVGVGLAAGGRRIPAELPRILASHTLLHAAEGDLYEQAVIEGCVRADLPYVTLAPKTILDDAASQLAVTPADLGASLTAAGKVAGVPWRKDHREAAAAAMVALWRAASDPAQSV
jgi:hypothetical protein